MRSLASPFAANLFMNLLATSTITMCPLPSKVWLRYAVDTFVIIKCDELDKLFKHVIIYNKIKFTNELESVEHKWSLLHCLVERKCNDSLKINKSAHHRIKVTVIKNSITRILKLVTEPNDIETKMNLIICNLMLGGYSRDFIKKIIKAEDKKR